MQLTLRTCPVLSTVCCGCRCRSTLKVQRYNRNTRVNIYFLRNSQQKTRIFRWKMRRGKLHISWEIIFQHRFFFFFFLVHFPASWSREHPSPLRSDVEGEGHAAQVAVSGWIVDDALPVQFALYLDVSVVLQSWKTHSHHRRGVVYLRSRHDGCYFSVCMRQKIFFLTDKTLTHMSGFPVVWIVLQFKNAFRKKLDFSQSLWRSFLKDEEVTFDIFFIDAPMR